MTAQPAHQPDRAHDLVDRVIDYVTAIAPALSQQREQIEQDLRAEFGGESHYVQARVETARQRRAREVLALFNGRNATEVARRLQISRASVYRYIKQPALARMDELRPATTPSQKRRLSQPTPTAETAPQIG